MVPVGSAKSKRESDILASKYYHARLGPLVRKAVVRSDSPAFAEAAAAAERSYSTLGVDTYNLQSRELLNENAVLFVE